MAMVASSFSELVQMVFKSKDERAAMEAPFSEQKSTLKLKTPACILGKGGYGVVERGVYEGREVAVKRVRTRDRLSAVRREVTALSKVQSHTNVVLLYGVHHGVDETWMAMDLAVCDLYAVVHQAKHLDEARARAFFAQMIDGVQHIHDCGVVHRDIKLENWLVFEHDVLKLADFGLAHTFTSRDDAHQRHRLFDFVGSRAYCAPEVLQREAYDGERIDAWSMMICLFAMTAGFFAFEEASPRDWRFARVRDAMTNDIVSCIFGLYGRQSFLSKSLHTALHSVLAVPAFLRPRVRDMRAMGWVNAHAMCNEEVRLEDDATWRSCVTETEAPKLRRMSHVC